MGIGLKSNIKWLLLLGLFALGFILWNVMLSKNEEGILTFAVLDIGQGDSLFIKSPTGKQILIDGGPGNNLSREIGKVLSWYDRSVDMIVVTNPDSDHYEGFIKFLDKYKVGKVLEPGTTNSYPAYEVLENKIKAKNIEKILARRGQIIDIGGGAYLQVYFPDRNVEQVSPNTGSIVMKLIFGETEVMLQGDSTSNIEEYLLNIDGDALKADILKVGHHGSKTSTIEEYVKAVSPKFAVISSGTENSYGHPHKETLETLEKLNVPTYDTCNNGMLFFKSDGKEFKFLNKNPKKPEVGCKI